MDLQNNMLSPLGALSDKTDPDKGAGLIGYLGGKLSAFLERVSLALGQRTINFETVANAKEAKGLEVGQKVSIAERNGAKFRVVLASSVSLNIYDSIECTGTPNLALSLIKRGATDIKDMGCVCDGVVDDSDALEYAFSTVAKGELLEITGTPKATRHLVFPLKSGQQHKWNGRLLTDFGIDIGVANGRAITSEIQGQINVSILAGESSRLWNGKTGLRLVNITDVKLTIGDVIGYEFGVDLVGDTDGSTHNVIHIVGRLRNAKRTMRLIMQNNGYVNENKFYGGSWITGSPVPVSEKANVIHLSMINTTSYIMNNNHWFSPGFEASVGTGWKAFELGGESNTIQYPRMEGANAGEVTADASRCAVISSFLTIANNIVDNGAITSFDMHNYLLKRTDEATQAAIRGENRTGAHNPSVAAYFNKVRGAALAADGSVIIGNGGTSDTRIYNRSTSPEGSLIAPRGSIVMVRQDSRSAPALYVKTISELGGDKSKGWIELLQSTSGATTSRPSSGMVGQIHFDTTLGKPTFHTGAGSYVDALGVSV